MKKQNNEKQIQIDYIEPFFVGLFEGDGSLSMAKSKGKKHKSYGQLWKRSFATISLKYLPENEKMLKLIAERIGGIINNEKKRGEVIKIKWIGNTKKNGKKLFRHF